MPDGNAAAQRVLGVAKLLHLCNFDVRFCGLSHNITIGTEKGSIDSFQYCNYPYPSSAGKWLKYLTGSDYVKSEIKSYKPNLVILYNHPAFAIENITRYCRKKGIKVIGDVTEWYKPEGNFLFRIIKGYDTNRRMNSSHLKLDGLICISSFLSDFYYKQGANVLELPPLVDGRQSKWHQKVEKHPDEIRMVYAGSPGAVKDRLDLILGGLDKITLNFSKPFRFDIIGITKEQYQNTWGDETERDYVVFNGCRPHNEVIKKLLESDFQIFLRPDSLLNRAGFPTKFVETVTSGTIPITNLSSNLHKYLMDGVNGFVVPSLEEESIERTIRRALGLTTSHLAIIKRQIDTSLFDYRNFIKECSEFLNRIS